MTNKPDYIERFLKLKPKPARKKHPWHDGETHLFQNNAKNRSRGARPDPDVDFNKK